MSYPRARLSNNGEFILYGGIPYFIEGPPSTLKVFQLANGLVDNGFFGDQDRDWGVLSLSTKTTENQVIPKNLTFGLVPRESFGTSPKKLFEEQYGEIEEVSFWENVVAKAPKVVDTAIAVGEPVRDVAKAVTDIGDSLFKGALAIGAAWGLFKLLSRGKK